MWIGYDSIVLAGAKIGKGSVIGARSVVTGTIPPYSVYVGNKIIKEVMTGNVVVDGRNIYDRQELEEIGFIYTRIGEKVNYEQENCLLSFGI